MASNEEPVQTPEQNDQISTQGHDLPEMSKPFPMSMPRQVSILDWIHQWQPMGYRIVLNLPFVGNDADFLFGVRNGPFIPRWEKWYAPKARVPSNSCYPNNCNQNSGREIVYYAWNNTRAVYNLRTAGYSSGVGDPSIVVTQFDAPPMLSTLAQCFRRWRGDMQYRIRVVAGFVTQGYIIITALKNKIIPWGGVNEYRVPGWVTPQDSSYKEGMQNAYILSDTSMIRHVETTMQFEYPVPYYDQYEWLAQRVNPFPYFDLTADGKTAKTRARCDFVPHGDNILVVGMRGNLSTGQVGSQLAFELEYRAVEGFQFADPGFPPGDTSLPYNDMWKSIRSNKDVAYRKAMPVKAVPSWKYNTNGFDVISEAKQKLESEELKTTRKELRDMRLSDRFRRIQKQSSDQSLVSRLTQGRSGRTGRDTDDIDPPASSWLGQSSRERE